MSWIKWDTADNEALEPTPDKQSLNVSNELLSSRDKNSDEYGGNLRLVPVPDNYWLKRGGINQRCLNVLEIIRNDPREFVPSGDVAVAARMRHNIGSVGRYASVLWAHGYIEKWATGFYAMGTRQPQYGRTKGDRGGQWFGVHYRMIKS